MMVQVARARWNRPDLADDNQADAMSLLDYAGREIVGAHEGSK